MTDLPTPLLNSPLPDPLLSALPDTLDDAVVQAQVATKAAIAAGYERLNVELIFPELKPLPIAQQFASAFAELGPGLKLFFTDAGTAAWARKNWDVPYKLASLDVAGTRQTTAVAEQVEDADRMYIFVAPTSVEVGPVEQICNAAGDRPCILFNPRLEDVAIIGIGYAGRQLRERFLTTIEPCYYLRPLDDTLALSRFYPHPWQLWRETAGTWSVGATEREKPDSEVLDAMVATATGETGRSGGLLAGLQQFMRALSR
jgi:Domain of unknown function (DUF1995)